MKPFAGVTAASVAVPSLAAQIRALFRDSLRDSLGGYYPIRPEYLYEDSAGLTPAAVDGVVGLQFDAKGKPERRRNLARDTQQPSQSDYWVKSNFVSFSADSVGPEFPNGEASLFELNVGSSFCYQTISVTPGVDYTFSFYVKLGTAIKLRPSFYDENNATFLQREDIDLVNHELIGNGTYRVILYITAPVSCNTLRVYPCRSDITNNGGTLWTGALQAEASTNATPYQKITTGIGGEWTPGNHAWQDTTANKPYLRQTPETGKYWLDGNTATAALNVTFTEALGANCTVARVRPDGVEWLELQTIGTTYNLITPYAYNSDTLIINRAMTTREKAQVERLLRRSVPRLGDELVMNGTFDTADGWALNDAVISNGRVDVVAGARFLSQNAGLETGKMYRATIDYFFSSSRSLRLGTTDLNGGLPAFDFASSGDGTSHAEFIFIAYGPFVAVEASGGGFTGWIDNVSVREIQ